MAKGIYTEGIRRLMLGGMRFFTRRIFPEMHSTPFVFGEHHLRICDALDRVVRGETRKLIINIAPRYGKTELVSKLFPAYGFAVNPASRFLHLSYSSSLVKDNSTAVKDIVSSPLFSALFPARVRRGKDTMAMWDTEQGGGMYAVSTLGQVTGFGAGATDPEPTDAELDEYTANGNGAAFAGAVVIDDPLKPEDALSDLMRGRVNTRFETTIRSRVNSRNTPIVIIMQRLHEDDLCGYLLNKEPGEWEVLSLPSLREDGTALWPHKHTVEELRKLQLTAPYVFETQYQQDPKPVEGLMYSGFRTYSALPVGRRTVKNYTDTADTGADRLCSVDYAEYADTGECYVLDVLYTDRPMEFTEPETARMLARDAVAVANIESNNGGRGFARNVERALRVMGDTATRVRWFTQTGNKRSRIFTRSADVQNLVFFPEGWERRWPLFHAALSSYRKEGRNAHDDAPDALTGVVEMREPQGGRVSRVARTDNRDD